MNRTEVVDQLKSQSTWRLFFLSLITLGIYLSHYMRRQTRILNQHLDEAHQISETFVTTILVFTYVTVIFTIPYIVLDDGHPLVRISDVLDYVWAVFLLIWAFMARNRMHSLLSISRDEPQWFHGLWTFLFTALYFNFKVNKMNKEEGSGEATSSESREIGVETA